eukprot:gene6348-6581_t
MSLLICDGHAVQANQVLVYVDRDFAGISGRAGVGDYRTLSVQEDAFYKQWHLFVVYRTVLWRGCGVQYLYVGVCEQSVLPPRPVPFNDTISSIRVPAGLKATLREHPNFGGRRVTITGPKDIPRLAAGPYRFNDITSSIKIESTSTGGGGGGGGGTTSSFASEVLSLVNAARRANGNLGQLSLDSQLNNAAQAHSIDQASRNTMTHTGSDGSSIDTRVTRTGYRWSIVGENVAYGFNTPASVHGAWMNSPGHRANILNGEFVHMGLAVATGSDNYLYWTQVFARRL